MAIQGSPIVLAYSLCIQVRFELILGEARTSKDQALDNVPVDAPHDCLQELPLVFMHAACQWERQMHIHLIS